ncbi:MAG: uracil-DNA glycosylase [Opitutales bacterium]|nr:uracil-DNA glycosylase [Opitutales bacterium]
MRERDVLVELLGGLRKMQREGQSMVPVREDSLEDLRNAVRVARDKGGASLKKKKDSGDYGEIHRGRAPSPSWERPSGAGAKLPDLDSLQKQKPAPKKSSAKKASVPFTLAPLPEKPVSVELPEGSPEERMNALREAVENCPVCRSQVREGKKVVFGTGTVNADLFFVGEAPGAEEEIAGEPFVGAAGQLLNKMIKGMGLEREQVYIGNIMKWRPATESNYGNRAPTEKEMEICLPYLRAQVEIVRPKVIVALGLTAVNGLFGYDPKRKMGAVRGHWMTFGEIPAMCTFHPSYLLHHESYRTKRLVWEDLLQVMEKIDLPISEKQRGYFLPK